MSDVNPLFVLIPAVLLGLIAYAVLQFLRTCQEQQRRGQKTEETKDDGRKGPEHMRKDFSTGRLR